MAPLRLLRVLVLLAPLALLPAAPAQAALPNGTYHSVTGDVVPATVAWDGPCDGWGLLTVTLHWPWGDEPSSHFLLGSTTPGTCAFSGARCLDCPPVPFAYGWSLRDPEGPTTFAGAGTVVYDRYAYWRGPAQMQGLFGNGVLQWHDDGDWLG